MKGYAALPTCKGSIFGPSHNDGVKSFFVIAPSQMLCFEIEALTALSDLEQLEGLWKEFMESKGPESVAVPFLFALAQHLFQTIKRMQMADLIQPSEERAPAL